MLYNLMSLNSIAKRELNLRPAGLNVGHMIPRTVPELEGMSGYKLKHPGLLIKQL
jgi:hypothetical protein